MNNIGQKQQGVGGWLMHSVSAKLIFIIILMLLLLIPSHWVVSLIYERQHRQREVIREISNKWAGQQTISGPVLAIPYLSPVKIVDKESVRYEDRTQYFYVLAEELGIDAQTHTELLHRGIFNAVVYQSSIRLSGNFGALQLGKAGIDPGKILWKDVRLVVGIGDLKGLKRVPVFTVGDRQVEAGADDTDIGVFDQNIIVDPGLDSSPREPISFRFELDLKGSHALQFTQLAKTTSVSVKGDWGSPKFEGQFLPDGREVTESGFEASWKVPNHFLSLPQQWTSSGTRITARKPDTGDDFGRYADVGVPVPSTVEIRQADAFGVQFLQPVDHYKKAERTAKYAILIILLTFVSLFFTEVITKKQVHIIQYMLIGAAMIIYYSLLLSFSEYVGFNMAYAIASLATVSLVSIFTARLLGQRKAALLFAAILLLFYLFIFVIIQLEEMALLFGSVGLFVTVALLMHFSAKINWLQQER